MEHQSAYLDLTILSASDLKRSWLSGDQTVAVAWVDPSSKRSTGVTSGGGSNVQWNEKLTLPLNDAGESSQQAKWLTIEIRSQGVLGDNLLGTVHVPLAELHLDIQKGANNTQTYQIVLPSGKRYGSVSFLGKVVKTGLSGSSKPLPSAPPASMHAYNAWSQSSALYPPVSHETYNEKPSPVHYSTLDALPYPPQACVSPNCATSDGSHHDMSPPYLVASHPPQMYPPVNAPCAPCPPCYPPPCAPFSNGEAISPYPPQFSSTPYPPPTSTYQQVIYPPNYAYPPTVPHHSQIPYPPTSWYPYPTHSSPLYPPAYPPPHASANWYSSHPAY